MPINDDKPNQLLSDKYSHDDNVTENIRPIKLTSNNLVLSLDVLEHINIY